MGLVVHVKNAFQPAINRDLFEVDKPVTIGDWLERQTVVQPDKRPTICIANGKPLLRAEWDDFIIRKDDVVAFVVCPRGGGGGSNPLRVVLMITVAVAAAVVAPYAAGAYASWAGVAATSAGAMAAGALASSMVGLGGMMLVNALLPPPTVTPNLRAQDAVQASPTYSLSAQGNRARIGEAIPVIYGRHQVYPDFAADPYGEYINNDQYLYQLFMVGHGQYDIEEMRFADSSLDSFEEVEYEIIEQNQPVTLFPANVNVAEEVSGQELLTSDYIGPFVVCSADETVNKIAFDLVLSKGLYYANDEGGLDSRSVSVRFEVREIDRDGNAVGDWQTVGTETITAATATPIRRTYRYGVADKRYEASAIRTTAKDTDARAGNDVLWAGLRGYIPSSNTFGDKTLIAVKARATNNLSSRASRLFNCIVARKLPAWDSATQSWGAPAPTRSIAWAIADMAKNEEYGAGLSDSFIDLDGLAQLDQTWADRGDYFDMVFDGQIPMLDALKTAARAGRAMPYLAGGVLRVVRDEPQSIPVCLFSPDNIIKNSFSIDYVIPDDDTADAVEVEYYDNHYWQWKTVLCVLAEDGSLLTSDKPAKIKISGVTDREHAWREGMYIAAQNRYRRIMPSFQTELEGHIPTLFDLVAVNHDVPSWGQSGQVVAWDAATRTITTDNDLDWSESGTYYIGLRKEDGSLDGPFVATRVGTTDNQLTIDSDPSFTPYTGQQKERTYYAFGVGNKWKRDIRVLAVRPSTDGRVMIAGINEDARVHQADQATTIPTETTPWPLPVLPDAPIIENLQVVQSGTPIDSRLSLSWTPAPGTDHYLIEVTTSAHQEWTTAGITSNSHFTASVSPGHIWLRVAAVGTARGPWVYWDGNVEKIPPPGDVLNLRFADPAGGSFYTIEWDAAARASWYVVQVVVTSGEKTLDDFVGQTLDTVKGKTLLEVLAVSGLVVREIETTGTSFTYTAEQMALDGGPWRQVTFKVKAVNVSGQSANWALLVGGNEPPAAVSNVRLYRQSLSCIVSFYLPADIDLAGVVIAISKTHGFSPTTNDIVWEGLTTIATISSMPDGSALEEGETYYLRIGTYDAFGKDSITWTTDEYSFVATDLVDNAGEVLSKVREALLDDTMQDEYGDFLFHSNRFGVVIPTGEGNKEKLIFGLTNIDGTDYVVLNADVVVGGNLSVSNLRDGYLPTDVTFNVGDGSVVIDGGGAGNASISVYDGPEGNPNRDYALLSSGDITFFRYIAGAYRNYKSLRRREYGTAEGNTTVTLPGYWSSPPSVIPFPTGLMVYNSAYADQDQSIWIDAQNVRPHPTDEGKYVFDCVAKWMLGGNNGTTTVNSAYQTAYEVWTSGSSALPTNTSSVSVKVSFKSRKGTGNHTHEYYYRQVRVRLQTSADNVTFYNRTDDVFEVGAQINDVVNKVIDLDIPAGDQYLRVHFEASNTGGTFSLGPDEYTYDTWQGTPSVEIEAVAPTWNGNGDCSQFGHAVATLSAWNMPAESEIVLIDYFYETAVYFIDNGGLIYCWNDVPVAYTSHGFSINTRKTAKTFDSFHYQTGAGVSYNNTVDAYVRGYKRYYDADIGDTSYAPTRFAIRNAYAVIRYRTLVKNSTESANWFSFDSYDWQIPAGSVPIENGSISYIAIGD